MSDFESKHDRAPKGSANGGQFTKMVTAEADGVELSAGAAAPSNMDRARDLAEQYLANIGVRYGGRADEVRREVEYLTDDRAAGLWVASAAGTYDGYPRLHYRDANRLSRLGWDADEHADMIGLDRVGTDYSYPDRLSPSSIIANDVTPDRGRVLCDHGVAPALGRNSWEGRATAFGDLDQLDKALESKSYRELAGVHLGPETPEAAQRRVDRVDAFHAAGLAPERDARHRELCEYHQDVDPQVAEGLLRELPESATAQDVARLYRRGHDGESVKKWGRIAATQWSRADFDQVQSTPKQIRALVAKGAHRNSDLAGVDQLAQAGIDGKRYSQIMKTMNSNYFSPKDVITVHENVPDPQEWVQLTRANMTPDIAGDIRRLRAAGVETPEQANALSAGFDPQCTSVPDGYGWREGPRRSEVTADLAERKVSNEQVLKMSRAGIPPTRWSEVPAGASDDDIWKAGESYREEYEESGRGESWGWRSLDERNED